MSPQKSTPPSFSSTSGNRKPITANHNQPETPSVLKEVFKDDFYIGVAINRNQISGTEPNAIALVEKHFNSITPENVLKWEEVHPEPNRYNFEAADRYVAFGERNNMFIIGHTLVWFHQTPEWVFQDESGKSLDREALLKRMKEHIFTVMGRYRGRIHGWDVVNESVMADGQLRKNKWLEIIGEDYILKAFEYARQADPTAQLYYNDYDLEKPAKCEGVIRLIRDLQSKGVRIDGVGTQGHWFLDYPSLDEIETSILTLSQLGIKLMVTELDVSVLPFYPVDAQAVDISSFDAETQKKHNPYPDALPESVQNDLAKRYAALFSLFHKHRDKLSRITFWAVHDGQSWRNYLPISGRTDYPMLFDRQCKPKPAFDVVANIFKKN
ncbi:MAG: endo-1,4-beta-xylanase [candidate division KSB1 bacterium]|nr:endo-1,4-beta-xylanase [candidate division KSB1 bacterium]MDZ7302551.1 endo-1,4-beta-xylanase [candidate division KSB1 bacterium]MDZ7310683.1 endo-1,4-beta-xylanase [candidate division KSB1 bacterium]